MFKFPETQELKKYSKVLVFPKSDITKPIAIHGFVESAVFNSNEIIIKTMAEYATFDFHDIAGIQFLTHKD